MNAVTTQRGGQGSGDNRSVLVVDDEPSMRVALSESLRRSGYGVAVAADGQEALQRFGQCRPWLVLTDMKMARMGGLDVLKEIKRRSPNTRVVVMTAYGTVETAVEAMKQGACDYLLKPFAAEALERVLTRLEAGESSPERAAAQGAPTERAMLTENAGMERLLGLAEIVATSQATVLINGESGTGKELLARFIHSRSPRAQKPFIAVNCAALPDGLLESELFGYERGAFTGALFRKQGKFEMANGGTLLLDEISEMTLNLQAKLLRVLQERELDRIGGREPIPVDIRVIATTNRCLREEVEQKRFREDLYYRLHVFPLTVPPLRERDGDIPMLARHFAQHSSARNGLTCPELSPAAVQLLESRPWRGNVRELENSVERAVLISAGMMLEPVHFHFDDAPARPVAPAATAPPPAQDSGMGSLWAMERDLIMRTLGAMNGNRTHAAKVLGISLRTLRNKLREYRQLNGGAATGEVPSLLEAVDPA
ncbi:MAG: sigma-54-dependent Fis family transcriptional regulator [Nitrospirae bacterium]|nr:sigma-54-dependent Fis family transcriptional regulator [Nitrospirota bacterium]